MRIYAPIFAAGLAIATLFPANAASHRPKSNNPNVKHAMRKAKKVRPAKYKPAKKSKQPARAVYGAR